MFIGMFTGSYAEILLDIVSDIFLTFLSLSSWAFLAARGGSIRAVMYSSGPLLAALGLSWPLLVRLLASLGCSWGAIEPLLASLVCCWSALESSWGALRRSWAALGALLAVSWALLGHSWGTLGRSWAALGEHGGLLGSLGALLGVLGRSWGLNTRRSRATSVLQGSGVEDFGSEAAPLPAARGYQGSKDLGSIDTNKHNLNTKHVLNLTRR